MPVKGKQAAKPRPAPRQAPSAKSYSKQQCLKDAKGRLRYNNMGCGTDPDPSNAFCYHKNYAEYQQQASYCGNL